MREKLHILPGEEKEMVKSMKSGYNSLEYRKRHIVNTMRDKHTKARSQAMVNKMEGKPKRTPKVGQGKSRVSGNIYNNG